MPRKKKEIIKEENTSKYCPSCLKKGKKYVMTKRSHTTIECPSCYAWRELTTKDTKREEKEKLAKRLAELDAEGI